MKSRISEYFRETEGNCLSCEKNFVWTGIEGIWAQKNYSQKFRKIFFPLLKKMIALFLSLWQEALRIVP